MDYSSQSSLRTKLLPLLVLCSLLGTVVFATAAGALAPGKRLSYDGLMQRLQKAPGNELQGYFKTVLQGSTIETIPATIMGYTPNGNWKDSLIFFQATGPKIAKSGGIASGMSGSPLYLNSDELIGAVAYGDAFTPEGHGLATPIEAMENLEDGCAKDVPIGLQSMQFVAGKLTDKVIITDTPEKHRADAAAGIFVARPLSTIQVGGLRPDTASYRLLKKALDKQGRPYRFVPTAGAGDYSRGKPAYKGSFEPGAAGAIMDAVGGLWSGSIGTVTYTNGNNVLLYGHPSALPGMSLDASLNYAWISAIMPAGEEAYKIGEVGATAGTAVQDSHYGVLARQGLTTPVTTVTTRARNLKTGAVETGQTELRQSMLRGVVNGAPENVGAELITAAIAQTSDRLFNYPQHIIGSAKTVTTVVLADGVRGYTVTLRNSWSGTDLSSSSAVDAYRIVRMLQTVNKAGLEKLQVQSVNVEVDYQPGSNLTGSLVSVSAPAGLRRGAVAVQASINTYGIASPTLVNASLNIPKKTKLAGRKFILEATPLVNLGDEPLATISEEAAAITAAGRSTVGGIVEKLQQTQANANLRLVFTLRDAKTNTVIARSEAETTNPTSGSASRVIKVKKAKKKVAKKSKKAKKKASKKASKKQTKKQTKKQAKKQTKRSNKRQAKRSSRL